MPTRADRGYPPTRPLERPLYSHHEDAGLYPRPPVRANVLKNTNIEAELMSRREDRDLRRVQRSLQEDRDLRRVHYSLQEDELEYEEYHR